MRPPVTHRLGMFHLTRPPRAMATLMLVNPVVTVPRVALRALPLVEPAWLIPPPHRLTSGQRPQLETASTMVSRRKIRVATTIPHVRIPPMPMRRTLMRRIGMERPANPGTPAKTRGHPGASAGTTMPPRVSMAGNQRPPTNLIQRSQLHHALLRPT